MTLPTERVVPLCFRPKLLSHEPEIGGLYSPVPIPVVLQICTESRDEALKRYVPAFTGAYIDPFTDVVLILNPDVMKDSPTFDKYGDDFRILRFWAASLLDWCRLIKWIVPKDADNQVEDIEDGEIIATHNPDKLLSHVKSFYFIDDILADIPSRGKPPNVEKDFGSLKNKVLRLDYNLYRATGTLPRLPYFQADVPDFVERERAYCSWMLLNLMERKCGIGLTRAVLVDRDC